MGFQGPSQIDGMRSACSSTEAGLRYQTGRGFNGHVNGCRYIKGVSWGVACLQTNTKENQDGWSIDALITDHMEPGRMKGMTVRHDYTNMHWSHEKMSNQSGGGKGGGGGGGGGKGGGGGGGGGGEFLVSSVDQENLKAGEYRGGMRPPTASKALAADALTFTVLDGHGIGGRHASAAVEQAFEQTLNDLCQKSFTTLTNTPPAARQAVDLSSSDDSDSGSTALEPPTTAAPKNLINVLIDVLDRTLSRAQSRIEQLNEQHVKDFGTTLVSVTIVNDVILTASCGDSSALLVAVPHDNTKPPLVVELGRRHHLTDEVEVARVQREGRGRIIMGDGGILRLIPANLSYTSAKKNGLSINMSRSLGHIVFKNYGLSVAADYTFLTLGTLPKLLKERQNKNSQRSYYRLPPLDVSGCKTLSMAYGASSSSSSTRKTLTTLDESDELASGYFEPKQVIKRTSMTSTTAAGYDRKVIPADIFILLLSDGVTDVFNSSCILEMIRRFKDDANVSDVAKFAKDLTLAAQERRQRAGSRADNCTCIAVKLIPNN